MGHESYRSKYCNGCGQVTQHEQEAISVINELHEREILRCCVCFSPTLRWANHDVKPAFEFYFPAPDVRSVPLWIDTLPLPMSELLRETLRAFADNHLWLVAMGSRTLIDMFALNRIGDVGGFNAKLARLQIDGYLSPRDVRLVKAAVEVGHEATHRNQRPNQQDCHAVLDIVEHLLQRIVLDIGALDHLQSRANVPFKT